MGMFKKGYEANREEKKRQDKMAENRGKRLFRFFLSGDGDEADLIFLTEEPVNFHEHTLKGSRNGKDSYDNYTCTQDDDCELCNDGDRAQFKGAFLVWDSRPFEYKDKNGKLTAPIKKNQTIGQVSLSGDNMTFIDGTGAKISLKAKAADAQANIFVRGWRAVFGY